MTSPSNRSARSVTSRPRIVPVGIALLLATVLTADGTAQHRLPSEQIRDTVLSNGLTVIAARNPVIPVVTIEIAFRNGAFTQLEPGEEGLPHLMEHMLFKGAGEDWRSDASELNASYNGGTGVESVTYYLTAPSSNLDKGVDMIADLVRSRRFSRSDLEEERGRVANELERNASDPFHLLDQFTDRVLWGEAFRQKNIGGNLLTIQNATTDDLKAHHERFYVPNNAALVVTGDIEHADVFEAASKHFDSWDRGDPPFDDLVMLPVPELGNDTLSVVEADAPDVTLVVAWQGPSENEDSLGAAAAAVFSRIVTQRISAAYGRLVDSGLFHFLSFSYSPSNHVGPIELTVRTVPEKVVEATRALRDEILMMGNDDYFTDEELQLAQTGLRVQRAFGRESAIGQAHSLAHSWTLGGVDRLERRRSLLETRSSADVRSYIAQYLVGKPKAFMMLVSTATINAHVDELSTALDVWEGKQ